MPLKDHCHLFLPCFSITSPLPTAVVSSPVLFRLKYCLSVFDSTQASHLKLLRSVLPAPNRMIRHLPRMSGIPPILHDLIWRCHPSFSLVDKVQFTSLKKCSVASHSDRASTSTLVVPSVSVLPQHLPVSQNCTEIFRQDLLVRVRNFIRSFEKKIFFILYGVLEAV